MDLDGPAPAVLLHRLTIHGQSGDKSVDGGRVPVPAGAPLALGPPLRGGRWKPAGAEERRTGEIPLKGAVVRFP